MLRDDWSSSLDRGQIFHILEHEVRIETRQIRGTDPEENHHEDDGNGGSVTDASRFQHVRHWQDCFARFRFVDCQIDSQSGFGTAQSLYV